MKLRELFHEGAPKIAGPADVEIAGLAYDSRKAAPGDVFFALPGTKTDGNRHAKDAIAKGAVAVVSELDPPPPPLVSKAAWVKVRDAAQALGRAADRFYGMPSRAMTVFGVTGTNGKTTTTYLLESIVQACGGRPGVVGTIEHRLDGRRLEKAENTTPISLDLLRLLARFRDGGATHVAMEVSSHALALKRADEVEFDAAIFTNLTQDHLDFHKTMEAYAEAKGRLFDLLSRASSSKKRRVAVLNGDDARAAGFARRVVGAEALRFGLSAERLDLAAERLELTLTGTSFELVFRGRRLPARLRLIGRHNVYNALGAAGAALGLGMPETGVLEGLAALRAVPGRLEPVEAGQDFSVFVDYAHTPDALVNVLGFLKGLARRRIITVFGCGGDRDRTKRGPMGLAAAELSDLVVVTSDNPRAEDPLAIIAEIEAPLKTAGRKNYKIQPDRAAAIEEAVSAARAGDVVLIAGKGHEDYQILRDRTVRFDDREHARLAVAKLR